MLQYLKNESFKMNSMWIKYFHRLKQHLATDALLIAKNHAGNHLISRQFLYIGNLKM